MNICINGICLELEIQLETRDFRGIQGICLYFLKWQREVLHDEIFGVDFKASSLILDFRYSVIIKHMVPAQCVIFPGFSTAAD